MASWSLSACTARPSHWRSSTWKSPARKPSTTRAIFLADHGADLDEYHQAALFSGETESLIFLQRNLDEDAARRWAGGTTPIWAWNVRWFQPLQTEEWLADVGVDGELVAFRHVVEETASGASLSEERAREIALGFLSQRGWDLDSLNAVSAVTDAKSNRTDHLFIWRIGNESIARDGDPFECDLVVENGAFVQVPTTD